MEEPRDSAVVSAECRKEPAPTTPAAATAGDEAARPAPGETTSTSTDASANPSANGTTPASSSNNSTNKATITVESRASKAKSKAKAKSLKSAAKNKKRRRKSKSRVVRAAVPADSSDSTLSDDDDDVSDSDSDSDDDADSDSDSSSSSSSSSDGYASRKKKNKKKAKKKQLLRDLKQKKKSKAKKALKSGKKAKLPVSDSDSDSDSSDSSSDEVADDDDSSDANTSATPKDLAQQLQTLRLQFSTLQQQVNTSNLSRGYVVPSMGGYPGLGGPPGYHAGYPGGMPSMPPVPVGLPPGHALNTLNLGNSSLPPLTNNLLRGAGLRAGLPGGHALNSLNQLDQDPGDGSTDSPDGDGKKKRKKKKKRSKAMRAEFKRVDWVWDTTAYTWKLQDTTETTGDSQYSDYIFHVRRTFDVEGKYRTTYVDIKSKLLRECLQDVIGNVRGVSLVDETPKMDPNMLFLHLEEFRTHLKHLRQAKPAGDKKRERRKNQRRLDDKRKQLRVLIRYLDKDYAKVKDSLYPMLDNGLITFDLLWALWKPNTLAYAHTYGSPEEPRAFRVEVAERQSTIMKGDFYYVDGKYFEFDGKRFGFGGLSEEIPEFQGARKITSLPCFPLKYHKDEAGVRATLVERGRKFVALSGVHYKSYSGMAFLKRKKGAVVKFNIQHSRIMVDSAIFRRINPNYYVSVVRPKDHDIMSDGGYSDDDSDCCAFQSDSDASGAEDKVKFVTKVFKNPKGDIVMARMPSDEAPDADAAPNTLNALPAREADADTATAADDEEGLAELTDEEYLIASPVVLGFAFSEKQWLEFSVASVRDIKWNEDAWDSLVLEPSTKDLIQALVKSRKYSAAQTIDDVIQGKGKGLVTVLHGPPGTGKTLTAEGISELLKCPLYMASAGELGTDSRYLEAELQKILDICHAWGAILLLDEADVFLEKRNMHDIHRNALVSIFLRQLEYFQGILFLTTNRVETFDEAFQSRIHIALRYDNLDVKAKKTIFKMFIDRVRALGRMELDGFTDEDLNGLAKHELNGREIKNVVGSAQDLAVNKGEALSMRHIRQVLDVHAKFGRDLRGGSGYEDAMRSYF